MAILAGVIGILSRFAGQLLNLTLGWATILLFGKVPQRKQIVLLVMVFGSLVWVALVIGVLVPDELRGTLQRKGRRCYERAAEVSRGRACVGAADVPEPATG